MESERVNGGANMRINCKNLRCDGQAGGANPSPSCLEICIIWMIKQWLQYHWDIEWNFRAKTKIIIMDTTFNPLTQADLRLT